MGTVEMARINGKKGGRPPGRKNDKTLEKEAVMKAYQQRVMHSADRLLDYQMALARGTTYLFKIEKELLIGPKGGKTYKSKRPELVTDVEEIRSYLEGKIDNGNLYDTKDPGATYYYITAKDPDGQVINSMLDRSLGRPTQGVDLDVTTAGEKLKIFDDKQIRRVAARLVHARESGKK